MPRSSSRRCSSKPESDPAKQIQLQPPSPIRFLRGLAKTAGADALAVTCLPPPLELEVLSAVDGVFRLQALGPAGSAIAIQRSGDFNQWESLGSRTLSPEGITTVEDAVSLDGQRFYLVLPQEQ